MSAYEATTAPVLTGQNEATVIVDPSATDESERRIEGEAVIEPTATEPAAEADTAIEEDAPVEPAAEAPGEAEVEAEVAVLDSSEGSVSNDDAPVQSLDELAAEAVSGSADDLGPVHVATSLDLRHVADLDLEADLDLHDSLSTDRHSEPAASTRHRAASALLTPTIAVVLAVAAFVGYSAMTAQGGEAAPVLAYSEDDPNGTADEVADNTAEVAPSVLAESASPTTVPATTPTESETPTSPVEEEPPSAEELLIAELQPFCSGIAPGDASAPAPSLDGTDVIVSVLLDASRGASLPNGIPDDAPTLVECVTTTDAGPIDACDPIAEVGPVSRRGLSWYTRLIRLDNGETLADGGGTVTNAPSCDEIADLVNEDSPLIDRSPAEATFVFPAAPTEKIVEIGIELR